MYFSQVERRKLTPREELSKEKRQRFLAGIQWKNGQSVEELNADIAKQEAEKIAAASLSNRVVYKSDSDEIKLENTQWWQIGKQFRQITQTIKK